MASIASSVRSMDTPSSALIACPDRTSGDICREDPVVVLSAARPPIAERPEFNALSIRDETPEVVSMTWFFENEEFASVEEVEPNYRVQTEHEYPRACGKPCQVGEAEVRLD